MEAVQLAKPATDWLHTIPRKTEKSLNVEGVGVPPVRPGGAHTSWTEQGVQVPPPVPTSGWPLLRTPGPAIRLPSQMYTTPAHGNPPQSKASTGRSPSIRAPGLPLPQQPASGLSAGTCYLADNLETAP